MRTLLVVAVSLLTPVLARAADQPPACTFGPGALPATTLPAGAPHGSAIPIDTVVVLMQENRSFDHYFGQLRHQSGPPRRASNPDPTGGKPIRRFHDADFCEVADLDHSWNGTHREYDGGKMDGFTAANVVPEDPTGHRTMGFYTGRDLPFYYKLYRTFAMGDRYFCSVLSQTFPNRYYLLAGTSFGVIRNVIPGVVRNGRSVFNLLDEASPPVTWKVYYAQFPFAATFGYLATRSQNLVGIQQYFADAQAGALPQVAFVDPIFLDKPNVETDEHPPSNVQVGERFVSSVIGAFVGGPQWDHGALFLTYDEHGGFYDHVPPPAACTPDDTPPDLQAGDEPGAFDRYGIRVPVVVVSPFARKHFVSHVVHDHTSILRFIETRFDLPALTRRDANADPMLEFFKFKKPSFKKPPHLPAAPVSDAGVQQCESAPSNGAP